MNPHALEQLRPKIVALDAIPTIPAVVMPLVSLLRLPADQVEMTRIVELASYDGTIAAQCMRMANSPLFGRKHTETVRGAVMALGLKRVEAILMGCCLNKIVPPDKWIIDPVIFWRHSLGCALVSRKMAQLIGYPDSEKAYLAGLMHDLGILVNTIACPGEFRKCIDAAREERVALHRMEETVLGFSHCQSGKILAEHWTFSADLVEVIASHHNVALAPDRPLVALIHISDLLCRLRDLGYGYYEAMGIDLTGQEAWATLVQAFPTLGSMDLARLTMDIDGAMDEIIAVVDQVFKPGNAAAAH
jgi:HD-like signal output (HDOD) protein